MISVVLLVVLLGGYWMLLLTPKRTAAKDAQARVATAQIALDAARSQLSSGQAAEDSFRRDRATVVKLGRVVPGTDDPGTVLVQLEAIAKRENVLFSSFSIERGTPSATAPTTSTTTESTTATAGDADAGKSTSAVAPLYPPGSMQISGGLGLTPIKITLEAPYFKLERYLRDVQRFAVLSAKNRRTNGRLFIVDGINYKPIEDAVKAASGTLQAEVYASVYFAPPIETPTAATGGTAVTPGTTSGTTSTPPASIGSLR